MENKIERFIIAQEKDYQKALQEIKNGKKTSHWIWYIFPELKGLGKSKTSMYYGITNLQEAKDYYNNDYLRNHLIEICEQLLSIDKDIKEIFGYPDYLKVKSCITLFEIVAKEEMVFKKIMDKFYNGERDQITIQKLEENQ